MLARITNFLNNNIILLYSNDIINDFETIINLAFDVRIKLNDYLFKENYFYNAI